jgi:ornithine cyclodeaminase/alanine dehydrogenase
MKSMEYRDWISKYLDINNEILYLTQEECREAEMPAKIGLHPLKNTPKSALYTSKATSFIHAMPAYLPCQFACGIKWTGSFPANRERFGYLQENGLLIYNDHESGAPLAVMDEVYITEIRTPAVSLVSAKYLANLDAKTFGMIGCGLQGRQHVKTISLVLPKLEKIYIYDIYEPAMDKLIKDIKPYVNAKIIKAGSYEDLVKNSEVICSATMITAKPEPKIKDEWVSKGQTLIMCDCHSLYEDKTMKRADKYLCDSIEQHELFRGYGYYPYGLPEIYGEIGEIAAGLKEGRENKDELIVSNNVGMAVEDIMLAKAIFDKALEKGVGTKLPL